MLPDGWKKRQVRDIAHVIRGASPRPKDDPRYYGGNIPRLMVSDVTRDGKYVTPTTDFLTDAGAKLSRPMPAGSLTIVCSGTVGIPSFLAVDACIHDGFLAVKDVSDSVCIDYLYYAFSSFRDRFENAATHGGVFTNLTTEILKEFEINLPPLNEQQKIAHYLSGTDAAIDTTKAVIKQTKKVKQGLLQTLLTRGIGHTRFKPSPLGEIPEGWRYIKLSDHTKKIGSGITPRGGHEAYKIEGIPLLRSQNVGWGKLLLDDVAYIYLEQHLKMAGSTVNVSSLLEHAKHRVT